MGTLAVVRLVRENCDRDSHPFNLISSHFIKYGPSYKPSPFHKIRNLSEAFPKGPILKQIRLQVKLGSNYRGPGLGTSTEESKENTNDIENNG